METNQSSEPLVDTLEVGTITLVSVRSAFLTQPLTITAVANEIRRISRECRTPNILLDFHRVEHLSIDFVSEMKVVADDVQMRGGTIRCCSLRKETRALLGLLGLNALYVGHTVRHALARHAAGLARQSVGTTTMPV